MIDKSGEYWHFCFDETCTPNPTAIRETVQKMFDEMAEMGDCWFMRAKPSIEIVDDFEGDSETRVYCRFSAKPTHSYEGNKLVAVTKETNWLQLRRKQTGCSWSHATHRC